MNAVHSRAEVAGTHQNRIPRKIPINFGAGRGPECDQICGKRLPVFQVQCERNRTLQFACIPVLKLKSSFATHLIPLAVGGCIWGCTWLR